MARLDFPDYLEHIRAESGLALDPDVVMAFASVARRERMF